MSERTTKRLAVLAVIGGCVLYLIGLAIVTYEASLAGSERDQLNTQESWLFVATFGWLGVVAAVCGAVAWGISQLKSDA